jgi:nicotinamidase-related amidase
MRRMPETETPPFEQSAVVLFVDHQHGIAEAGKTADRKCVDEAAGKLARAAQIYDIPIVVSAIGMGGEPQLTHNLREALTGSVPIRLRNGTDSLDDRDILHAIEQTGRKTLVVCGIVTEVAVQRAALGAAKKGYRVMVALDACNGKSERSEWASVVNMQQAGIEMWSVPAILGVLMRDFSDDRSKQALALLSG